MSGAFGLRLGPDEYVFDHFYNRASVSLGYIGCHEMLQFMLARCRYNVRPASSCSACTAVHGISRSKEETKLGYSLYATPSESLCDVCL